MAGSYKRTRKSIKKALATRAANKASKDSKTKQQLADWRNESNQVTKQAESEVDYLRRVNKQMNNEIKLEKRRILLYLTDTVKELTKMLSRMTLEEGEF